MIVEINFSLDMNVSLQVGDTIYYCEPKDGQAGKNHPNTSGINTKPKKYGKCVEVDRAGNKIKVNVPNPAAELVPGKHYLMFGKDRRANTSGIVGYFAETEFRNYTTLPAEIFATAADWVESSK